MAGHAVGTVAVAVCVLCGHQRDVPAHSMLQLCAEVSCRSCMRQQSAGHTLTDQPAAPVVAPCVCLRACVSRCRGAVGASHPLSQGRNQLQRRSSPPPPPLWQNWSAPRTEPAPTADSLGVHAIVDAPPLPALFCVAYVCTGALCVFC